MRRQAQGSPEQVNDTLLLRDQFSVDDRTFTVLAEPWYDADVKEWRARYL
jgi:hypothetical protein